MGKPFLTAIAIWSIGCVIPTPLEAERGQNQPPIITVGDPDFLKGVVNGKMGSVVALTVKAVDTSAQTTLQAALFYVAFNSFIPVDSGHPMDSLGTSQGALPLWSLTFTEGLCDFNIPGRDKLVYVYVANQPFPHGWDPQHKSTPASPSFDGDPTHPPHYDYKYWVLNCE